MSKAALQTRWNDVLTNISLLDKYKQYFFNHEMRYVRKTIVELLAIDWDWSNVVGYEDVCELQVSIAEGCVTYLNQVIQSDILSFTV